MGLWRRRNGELGSRVTVLIKSFRRFECLERAVRSVRHYYPTVPIEIADDSYDGEELVKRVDQNPIVESIRRMAGVTWHQLPFDTGLSAGRNYLVGQAKTPYVLNMDDDWVFTPESKIEPLLDIVENGHADVAAACLRFDGSSVLNWCGHMSYRKGRDGAVLEITPLTTEWRVTRAGTRYRYSDLGHNCFVAATKTLKRVPWDDRIKIVHEHLDHYLSMHLAGLRRCYTVDSIVGHLPPRPLDYAAFRNRQDGERVFREKWGLWGNVDHLQIAEPGLPSKPVIEMMPNDLLGDLRRPNIIVLGVGHSGTTIVAKMLRRLGWNAGPVDPTYCEHAEFREINNGILNGYVHQQARMEQLIREMPEPWVLKDPRLVQTLTGHWLRVFWKMQLDPLPTLLYLTRDIHEVERSYAVRREKAFVPGLTQAACQEFCAWPGPKFMVNYDRLASSIALFDVHRAAGTARHPG